MIKVCKFGGTSLNCAENFLKVSKIVLSDKERKIIVVSAPGKRYVSDVKITDLLISLSKNVEDEKIKNQIIDRFSEITRDLKIDLDIKNLLNFQEKLSAEYIISRGEYLSAKILAKITGYRFIDAVDLLKFNAKDRLIDNKELPPLNDGIIVPGFYRLKDERLSLFPRGGSDISASYLSKIFKADIYENFSDVLGIYPVNPLILKCDSIIDEIDYKDYENLKYLNPKVFAKSAYKPIIGEKIIINIRSTFRLSNKGTFIYPTLGVNKTKFISVSKKGDLIIISGRNLNKKSAIDKLKKILNGNYNYKIARVKSRLIFIKIKKENGNEIVKKLVQSLPFCK